MDEAVLKKISRFLQTQTDNEATFSAFWDRTKCFYPAGQSKSKLKAWLKAKMKHYPGRFEIIKSESGDPFGKIKLKVEEPSSDLPDTTWAEDAQITTKLIEFVDNTAEGIKHGHLYSTICTKKALVFPEKLQDKKYIRLWLVEHENLFKLINDPNNGGLFALEVKDEARNLNLKEPLMAPAAGAKKTSHTKTTPKKAKDDTAPVDLYKLADNIVQRISEKVKNAGGTMPIESLLKAKDVIAPLCEEDALNTFLTKFPEKFELIDLEGIGKWVHLKGADKKSDAVKDPVGNVTSFILKNGGTVPFGNLVKEASALIGGIVNSSDDLLTWLSYNANNFEVIPKPDDPLKPWQVKVKLGSFPRFCQHYLTQGQCPKKKCQFLHICKAYICQRPHEFCNFSHNIRDEHNKTVIDRMGVLSKETDVVVLKVLLKSCFPRVCADYNKNGVCPRGDNCHFLHICGNYVLNQCENPLCSLSHNVIDGLHNINVLKRYALLPSPKLSVDIVKTNIAIAQVPRPSIDVEIPKLPQYLERMLHGSRAGHYSSEVKATTSQPPQSDKGDEKKKHRCPRRRGRRHGQASSTADDGSLAGTDSSVDDDDDASVASSSHSAKPSLLSSENIQKSNLATPLSGAQKVGNWMGNYEDVPIQQRTRSDSTSSSEVSYVSNQSSVVSSQSSMLQDDLEKKVFIAVLEKYNGEALFKKISKDKELFGNDVDVVKWFENHSKMFILNRNGQGKIDSVSAFAVKARICLDYNGRRGCPKPVCGFLHLCRNHIETRCPKGKGCTRSHDVGSDQVCQTVKRMGLPELSPHQLVTLIRFSVPIVCCYYNQGPCNRGKFCPNLHVCKNFIKGRRFCKAKPCKYGHEEALRKAPAVKLLKMYRLYGKQPNFKYIRKMIFEIRRPSRVIEQSDGGQRQVSDEPKPLMDVDLTQKIDNQEKESEEVVPNICLQFLIDQCRGKKCPDVHFSVPYCWQFNTTGSWQNFNTNDCEMIEKYFCDANCAATELNISTTVTADVSSVRLDFQSMSGHPQPATGECFKIRRLQCEQSGNKHDDESWYETQWLWYELKSSKWIKYDTAEANVYEKLYSKGSLPVDWSTQRRRPASYLTKSEVKKKKRSMKEQQKLESTSSPPPQSPVSSHPPPQSPVSCHPPPQSPVYSYPPPQSPSSSQPPPLLSSLLEPHRTRVEPGTREYKEIEGLLVDSTGQNTLVVNHIDKIVSDGLWEKYKSKKKSMTDDLRPGEKLNEKSVFIPCLHEDLQRIMKGNVGDSRIILPEPLGHGYYFTSDASFCVESCREHLNLTHSQFYLIVCQVLLGTCTQGARGLFEFPRRADGRFYDSLVDNKDDPTVFVIKNIEQCYPAFVIGFYTATPSNEGLENVSESPIFPQPNYPPVPPAYQEVSHDSRPLSQGYVPPSSTTTPSPLPAYVKAVPVNSGIPPTTSDPPPYTPYPSQPATRAAGGEQPGNVRPVIPSVVIPNIRSTARRPGDPKDKCVVM